MHARTKVVEAPRREVSPDDPRGSGGRGEARAAGRAHRGDVERPDARRPNRLVALRGGSAGCLIAGADALRDRHLARGQRFRDRPLNRGELAGCVWLRSVDRSRPRPGRCADHARPSPRCDADVSCDEGDHPGDDSGAGTGSAVAEAIGARRLRLTRSVPPMITVAPRTVHRSGRSPSRRIPQSAANTIWR